MTAVDLLKMLIMLVMVLVLDLLFTIVTAKRVRRNPSAKAPKVWR